MENIAILGNGLLGKELHAQTGWDMIARSTHGFDITKPETWDRHLWRDSHGVVFYPKYKTLINCMAHTDTYSHDRSIHWETNYRGVVDLVDYCKKHGIKLVHISTDHVYSGSKPNASEDDVPVHCCNWYGYTKLLGDAYVQLDDKNLVIRTTHKRKPFVHEAAWVNQYGNFDYVDIIASYIVTAVLAGDTGVLNIGTELKTMYDLAKQTKRGVKGTNHIIPSRPVDVSMDISKLKKLIEQCMQ
jgi:dTDP-4-dehydrorhamnose reductase